MRALSDASSSGENLLNRGAISRGQAQVTSRLNPNHAPQPTSHQCDPAVAMIHSTQAAIAPPRTSPRAQPLSRSATKVAGRVRLKPKRCSRTNVR